MSKTSRTRIKHIYQLLDRNQRTVNIDLNNYPVRCTVTGARKSFYHKYLAQLIQDKYDNNIDTFRTTYVSRAGRPTISAADRLQQRINHTRNKLEQLLQQQASMNTL